jgi:hypothetical protein
VSLELFDCRCGEMIITVSDDMPFVRSSDGFEDLWVHTGIVITGKTPAWFVS